MSIGPMGGAPVSAVGSPLAQILGAEAQRAGQDLAAQQRQAYYAHKADAAAGVGQPDGEDHETADRDADGRLPWEPAADAARATSDAPPKNKDATGQSGSLLDLTG